MRRYLGTTTLHNTRWIYQEGNFYVVEKEDRRGLRHTIRVPSAAVEYLREKLRIGPLDAQSAATIKARR